MAHDVQQLVHDEDGADGVDDAVGLPQVESFRDDFDLRKHMTTVKHCPKGMARREDAGQH